METETSTTVTQDAMSSPVIAAMYGMQPTPKTVIDSTGDTALDAARTADREAVTAMRGRTPVTGAQYGVDTVTSPLDTMYDQPPEGCESYDRFINVALESAEQYARGENHKAFLEDLAPSRKGLNEFFNGCNVGKTTAQTIAAQISHYLTTPARDAATLEMKNAETVDMLEREYGRDGAQRAIAGAKRVVSLMTSKVPAFQRTLNNGLGAEKAFVQAMVGIAKRRGFFKP
jgi:hypothetical protein